MSHSQASIAKTDELWFPIEYFLLELSKLFAAYSNLLELLVVF